jgi:hypothetical protein|tara:strand:+ start:2190 stop:2492 length:303 start_codon:yes stop_codon:yes gene_type:complete
MNDFSVSESSKVQIPIRNLISMIGVVAVSVWLYFGIESRINNLENDVILISKDIELNSEFRILWPRGQMGALPDDAIQDIKIAMLEEELKIIKSKLEETN